MRVDVRSLQQLRRVRLAQDRLGSLTKEVSQRPWATALLNYVLSLLADLQTTNEEVTPGLTHSALREEAMRTVESSANLADTLQRLMGFITLAHGRAAPQVFHEILVALEAKLPPEEGKEGQEGPVVLITGADAPRNYDVTTKLFSLSRKAFRQVFPKAKFVSRLAVVRCPEREFEDALQHAAIFHEYGHAFVEWLDLEVEVTVEKQMGFFEFGGPGKGEELQADAVASYVAGPAPALALAYKSSQATETASHPSMTQRIAVALRYLQPYADDEYIKWACEKLSHLAGPGLQMLKPELPGTIDGTLHTLFEKLENYPSSKPSSRIEQLARRICEYVPPDLLNKRSPLDFRSADEEERGDGSNGPELVEWTLDPQRDLPSIPDILNAGWYVRLEHDNYWDPFLAGLGLSPDNPEDNFEGEDKLNALLMNAMETVHLVRRYEEQIRKLK